MADVSIDSLTGVFAGAIICVGVGMFDNLSASVLAAAMTDLGFAVSASLEEPLRFC